MRFASQAAAKWEKAESVRPALKRMATVAAPAPKRSAKKYAKIAVPMRPPASASMKKSPEILATIGRLSGVRSRSRAGCVSARRAGSRA